MRAFILFLLLALTTTANAAPELTQSEADQQLQQGKDAFIRGEYAKSLDLLNSAFQFYEQKADKQRMADTLYQIGRNYRRLSKFSEAIQYLNRAMELHGQVDDKIGGGLDLTEIAITYQRQGKYDEAYSLSEKALVIHEATGNQEGLARTLENFGNICFRWGEFGKAIEYFQRAESAATQSKNGLVLGTVLNNLAQVYWSQGEYQLALETYERAKKLTEEAGDFPLLAVIISNEAIIHWDQGDLTQALKETQQTNLLFQQIGSQQDVAAGYLNIGSMQLELGNLQQSQEAYLESLKMAQQINDKGLEASVLNSLGDLSRSIGCYDSALDYVQRALRVSQKAEELRSSASCLSILGFIYENQHNYIAALQTYRKSLQIFQKIGEKKGTADNLLHIGAVYSTLRRADRALANYKQALAILESMGSKPGIGASYMMIGAAYRSLGKMADAEEALTRAIETLTPVGMPDLLWPALYQKGLVCRDTGKTTEAIQWMKQSVDVIEQVRGQVPLTEQKWTYFENKLDVYEDLVSLLVEKEELNEAFYYVQSSKARSFLDMLTEARIDPKADLDPELFNKKKTMFAGLMNLNKKIRDEYESDSPNNAEIERLAKARNALNEEYLNLIIEIRKQNPRYANLQHPQPLTLSDAQALLNEETAILDYSVGRTQSFLFVITSSDCKVFRLPAPAKLNGQIRELLEVMQKPDPVEQIASNAYARYKDLAALLYQEIFVPAVPILKGKSGILIAPDGIMNDLPFESLLTTKVLPGRNDFSTLPYLTLDYQIQYVPSISALAALMGNANAVSRTNEKRLIAFANPAAKNATGLANKGKLPTDNTFREWSGSLTDLPYTKAEVEGISKLYTKDEVTLLLGKNASEQNAKTMDLENYNIVHFASHGLIDEERPEFSALVLTPGGSGEEDGFLTMREVFDLRLNADLVVLSACKTGLGQQIRGEGVAGLSRAFFGAGASRVLVSLWNVNDHSTSDFMIDFYRGLTQEPAGGSAALRKARLDMIRGKKYSHPYYWAPFILVGIP
jgi:CHAT domain-containing protein/uncharacterized protein HemY